MKKIFTLILLSGFFYSGNAQQVYMDFEGTKAAALAEWNGTLMDSMAMNPASNSVNTSSVCGKYTRSTDMYDNFKLFPYATLVDVSSYAVTGGTAPKITMKVYSSAPAGTKIDLQLGTRTNTTYPAGVHSEYTATTTVQNAWELVTFDFVKIPTGSTTNATQIDKIVVLFNPGTTTTDTYYFDEPTGPMLTVIGLPERKNEIEFLNTSPNPATDFTTIKFQTASSGKASLKLIDLLGRPVKTILNDNIAAGTHEMKLETQSLPAGTYFVELKKDNNVQTSKLVITK